MKLKLILAAAATAALLAIAFAGCMNPSDGTTFGGGGGGGGGSQARPYAALIGTWGDPPAITFNADGTGFFHNPQPFLWTATGSTITITNVPGVDGEQFSISVSWTVTGADLFFDDPAGEGESVLAALIAIAEGQALVPGNPDDPFMLRLSGQMWVERWDDEEFGSIVERFTGNGILLPQPTSGGIGTVTNGQLSFTMGAPPEMWSIDWLFPETQFANRSVSVPGVMAGRILQLATFDEDGNGIGTFNRHRVVIYYSSEQLSSYSEQLSYVFVDQDVVITGGGMTSTETETLTIVTTDLNVSLRAGWNILHRRTENLGMIDGVSAMRLTNSIWDIDDPSDIPWAKREW